MKPTRTMKLVSVAAFACVLTPPFAGCLDPQPLPFSSSTNATASAACLKCLGTPDVPGPGCADEIAACRGTPTCSRSYDCSLQRGCIGGAVSALVACLPECTRAAGIQGSDDPGRITGLAVYECITRGACASLCFTDATDAGPATPDAADTGGPPEDAGDAAIGDACLNAADQAVASDSAKVQETARTCGIQCFGGTDPECTDKCMETSAGFSKPCAKCWGDSIDCVTQFCLVQCLNGGADPQCQTCTAQYCTPAFHACSGT